MGGVLATRQQVVGIVERNEALGVLRRTKDARGVVDADDLVERRMEDEQRPPKHGDVRGQLVPLDVVEKLPANAERPPNEQHLRLAPRLDLRHRRLKQPDDVRRLGGGGDGAHRPRLADALGRVQHRRSAETVADQQLRRLQLGAQPVCRSQQITDIGGEVGVRERFAFRS